MTHNSFGQVSECVMQYRYTFILELCMLVSIEASKIYNLAPSNGPKKHEMGTSWKYIADHVLPGRIPLTITLLRRLFETGVLTYYSCMLLYLFIL